MLSVANTTFMLSVVMANVVMLSVVAPSLGPLSFDRNAVEPCSTLCPSSQAPELASQRTSRCQCYLNIFIIRRSQSGKNQILFAQIFLSYSEQMKDLPYSQISD
jgi:hypothetical protein